MDERKFEIDIFRPEDAEGVARLFTTVYGAGYPIKLVYDPGQLIGAFNKKDNIPVVARAPEDDIVGYVAMFRSTPYQKLYEAGQGLVLPDYRNLGIAVMLDRHIFEVVAKELNIDAVFGEAVCNHTHMQKACAVLQAIETAVEVDLMPAEAYAKEKSASGRVSTLDMFRTYRAKPQNIYIPPIYNDVIRFIYSAYDDTRDFVVTREPPPKNL